MYIKRKVYSSYIDENGEEKLFSTTKIMSEESYLEKLYSESEIEQGYNEIMEEQEAPSS